jgi:hypothetical protein
MGQRSFYNNQGKFFAGVPIQILVNVTADTTTGTYDVPCPEEGIITGAVFIKGTGTGGAGDTVELKSVLRNGTAVSVSGAKSINTVTAKTQTLMPIDLANTTVQARGFIRVVATYGAGHLLGTMVVTILPTA